MAGSSLDKFIDFTLTTRGKLASSPNTLVSMASKYRTHLWPLMLKGLTEDMIVQSGNKIIDYVQLKYNSSFSHYNVDDDFTYTATDSMTPLEVPWRFSKVHSVTHEAEIDLQNGDERTVYKKVKKAKQSEMELSWFEGMEDALWATPDNATMEAAVMSGTGAPLSLRVFIPDDGAALPSGFTTVMTVNPTTFPNWAPQVVTFDNTSAVTREATYIPMLDDLWLSCQYKSPTNTEEYVQSTKLQKMRILHNKKTILLLVKLATSKNNVLSPKNDIGWANGVVVYHGLPTDYIAKLDTIDTGNDTGTSNLYKSRFINLKNFKPIFHAKHNREVKNFNKIPQQPHSAVLFENTWHNTWCSNRRENGVGKAA